jgi:hypothetical protein
MKTLLMILPFLAACSSSYMRDAGTSAAPGPGESKIVVYRGMGAGFARTFPVYDGEELLGFTEVNSYFEALRKPGEHLFIAWGESDGVVHAELAPGKTYYLEFYPRMGVFSAGAGLDAVPATPDKCVQIDKMLGTFAHREIIPERGASWEEKHREKEAKLIQKHSAQEPGSKGLLRPEDGR